MAAMKQNASAKCYLQKTHKYIDKTAIFYILTHFTFRYVDYNDHQQKRSITPPDEII